MFNQSKLFLAIVGFAAATGAAHAKDTLKIGIIESISGPAAAYGENHRMGTRLAVDLINQAGGFNGKPIEIVAEDDRSDPAAGINAAKKLLTQQ
ncbi:MAG: ABC transporter substrate-binding protein, partial [Alcaligenaceae bacterium]|nr:ABC transporter substrate-binding protein [Alcaligenaceae bacterium]